MFRFVSALILFALIFIPISSRNTVVFAQTSGSYSEFLEEGMASWYGPGFNGRKTANGERFDTNELTCAHKTLPFNTLLKVTNVSNGRYTIVRVNDRGPYAKGRIIDLSHAAKSEIGMDGLAKVRIEEYTPVNPSDVSENTDYSLVNIFESALTKNSKVIVELEDSHHPALNSLRVASKDELRKVLSSFKKVKLIVDQNNSISNSSNSENQNIIKSIDLTDKVSTFTGYSIEVADFNNLEEAEKLVGKLESLMFNEVMLVEIINKDSVNFKVFVGYYENEDASMIDLVNLMELNFDAKLHKILG